MMANKQEEVKKYCSKCNRCLTDESGETFAGMEIRIEGLDKSPHFKEQLGKYVPKGDYVVFRFCYECWLNSLFTNSPYLEG